MANDRLRDALMTARVTHEELAADLGVHTKTVERWITQGRTPYPQFRHRISVLVQKDEAWLWPDGYSRKRRGEISRVRDRAHLSLPGRRAATSCGPGCSRTRPRTSASWSTPGSSWPSSTHRTIELLKQKADDGASIRILLGDPDCPQVALRGQEEDIGDAIAAKIRNVLLAYYMPLRQPPGDQHQAARHDAVQLDLLVRRRHAGQHPRLRGARAFRPGPAPAAPQLRDPLPDLRPQLRPGVGPDPQDLDRAEGDL